MTPAQPRRTHAGELPSVTVVVPTRDRPLMLERALQSVWQQDYLGHVTALVVFDQSEPHVSGADVAPDRCLQVLVNDRTPGASGARNTGLVHADTEVVAFLDDDDEWLPDKLSRQVPALLAATSTGTAPSAVGCGLEVVARGASSVRLPESRELGREQLLRSRATELHLSTLVALRETVLHGIGLFDEDIPRSYGEDYDWLLRAVEVGPVLALPDALVRIYWHPQSYFTGKWRTVVEALEYLMAKHPEFAESPKGLARLHGRLAFAHAALGERGAARTHAAACLRLNRAERRAYLSLLVAAGVPAPAVLRVASLVGKGV
jgi:glycosyltransferase involved in cell wall biosynthesis